MSIFISSLMLSNQKGGDGMQIEALTPARAGDFFGFFEGAAFCDHPDWAACYCLEGYLDREENRALYRAGQRARRLRAAKMIEEGAMHGYLAYAGGRAVGWCNAGPRGDYRRLSIYEGLIKSEDEGQNIWSAVCFCIAPPFRSQGVATALLRHVCVEAKKRGAQWVEGYPNRGAKDCYEHYHGPKELYLKCGFSVDRELEGITVMRRRMEG